MNPKEIAQQIAELPNTHARVKELNKLDKSVKGTVRMYLDNIMLRRQQQTRKRNVAATRRHIDDIAKRREG